METSKEMCRHTHRCTHRKKFLSFWRKETCTHTHTNTRAPAMINIRKTRIDFMLTNTLTYVDTRKHAYTERHVGARKHAYTHTNTHTHTCDDEYQKDTNRLMSHTNMHTHAKTQTHITDTHRHTCIHMRGTKLSAY